MQKDFPVADPPGDPRILLGLLMGIPVLMVLGLGMFGIGNHPMPALATVLVVSVFLIAFFILNRAMQRRAIALDNGVLEVLATFYRHRVPVQDMDLDKARAIDLRKHVEWRPYVKTNCFSMPGLHAGWFRSRNLTSLFCLITNRQSVLLLPLRAGGALLLSADRPTELLAALRAAGDAQRRGR